MRQKCEAGFALPSVFTPHRAAAHKSASRAWRGFGLPATPAMASS